MKQILQNLNSGQTLLAEVPCPQIVPNQLLIASRCTLISTGTERMLTEFGKANVIDKARKQPDKVKQVLEKVKTDGILPTLEAVKSKLDQPIPLGYCNAGIVLESAVEGFEKGDRVVSNGPHAEVVRVAKNLCAKIPDNVTDEMAAFTVLASIGLQGIRLANPTLGEKVVVTGLGLVGLLCVQMLRANGCDVLGIDIDTKRCKLAEQFGAETVDLSLGQDPVTSAQSFSKGRGVDAVIVATATQSDMVIQQAAEMSRKRGRIVLVGVAGLNLRRDAFFEKELTFQVSASYGPGRYDPCYEEKGNDYPLGFVRWTEQRNFEAVLNMMATGRLDVTPLITHRFNIDDALNAYENFSSISSLGVLINYPAVDEDLLKKQTVNLTSLKTKQESNETVISRDQPLQPNLGFVGAGNYASRILIPAFKKTDANLDTLVTSGGVSGAHHGKKAGFKQTTTDFSTVLHNRSIDAVVIASRHNAHSKMVIEALSHNKHVFVEKPLAITLDELEDINQAYLKVRKLSKNCLLMIGFNRRFAPHILKMKSLIELTSEPKSIIMTVNAGHIPDDHWTQNTQIGGGRIIGEGCHFIDLMRHLVGQKITNYNAIKVGKSNRTKVRDDKVIITLEFEDGSIGSIHYLANGGKSFPKERIEVFCNNAILQLDNYQTLKGYNWPGFRKMKLWRMDKGQHACSASFIDSIIQGNEAPIPYDEIMESSRVSIEIAEMLR